MALIDIGPGATNRNTYYDPGATVVDLANPANDSGALNSIEIWSENNLTGTNRIATFSRDGANFTPRERVTIGSVTGGSKQTFTIGIDVDVVVGDFLGFYWSSGYIEFSNSAGSGIYYKSGDQTAAGEQTYESFTTSAISIYATGVVTAAPTVTTQAATSLIPGGATLNGNITDAGGLSISQHGFCWKAGSDPVNIGGADDYSELGAGAEGAFDQEKTGLTENTLFYYRAYATNSEDTSYGAAQSFTTGETHSGVVAIGPAVGVSVDGHRLARGASPISIGLEVAAVGNAIKAGVAALDPDVTLAVAGEVYVWGAASVEPSLGLGIAASVIRDSAAPIGPAVGLAIAAGRITLAAAAIGPEANLTAIGNRIADAGIDIEAAVNLATTANRIALGAVAIDPEIALAVAAVILRGGVVSIEPDVDVESIANFLWASASAAIEPALNLVTVANRITSAAVEIGPEADLEAIGNRIASGDVDIETAVNLATVAGIIRAGDSSITVEVSLAAAAIALFSGQAELTPDVTAAITGIRIASAVAGIDPDATVAVKGNYITLASAAIAIAVSQSALCTKVILGGTVAITVEAGVAATAIRYMLIYLGLSGDLAAGSVIQIDSDKMTFKIDGVNVLKDMVGDFFDIPPDEFPSVVEYDDDEVARDVDVDLTYTPRDA